MSHSVEKLDWLLETLIPHISPWALFFTSFCHWYQSTILSFWCSGFLFTFPNNTVLISFYLLMKIHSKLEDLTITSIHHIEAKLHCCRSSLFCSTQKKRYLSWEFSSQVWHMLAMQGAVHQSKGLLCLPSAKPDSSILFLGLWRRLDQRPANLQMDHQGSVSFHPGWLPGPYRKSQGNKGCGESSTGKDLVAISTVGSTPEFKTLKYDLLVPCCHYFAKWTKR